MRAFLLLFALTVGCRHAAEPDFPDTRALYAEVLARVDADGDGRLSQEEYLRMSRGEEPFAKLDVNQDGALDLDEVQKAIETTDPGYREMRSMSLPVNTEIK